MPWGCGRFDRWCSLMTKAMDKGHVAVVFYKKGWLQEHGAENSVYPLRQDVPGEVDFRDLHAHGYEGLRSMGGLGASQKSEVAWLKKQGYPFLRVDVGQGMPGADAGARALCALAEDCSLSTELGCAAAHHVVELLRATGDSVRARQLCRRLLSARVAMRGAAAHLDCVREQHRLADLLAEAGEQGEARGLFEYIACQYAEQLGAADAATLAAKGSLAALAESLGAHSQARAVREDIVATRTECGGPGHMDTLLAKLALAGVLQKMGSLDAEQGQVRTLYGDVIREYSAQLGPTHADTLAAKTRLALALAAMGELEEAKALHQEVISGSAEAQGQSSTATLVAKTNLVSC